MCFSSWSKDPKPTLNEIMAWRWGPGKYVVEGDSNVHLTDVRKYFHPDAFNISMGGDIPQGSIEEFPQLLSRHLVSPVEKAYLQTGGNLWTWKPLDVLHGFNINEFRDTMDRLINLYTSILDPEDVVIGSLPYVYPRLTLGDMKGIGWLPDNIEKRLAKIRLNDMFLVANIELKKLCDKKGVHYLDVFTLIKQIYGKLGKKTWWDSVHYALTVQAAIGSEVRELWGVWRDASSQ